MGEKGIVLLKSGTDWASSFVFNWSNLAIKKAKRNFLKSHLYGKFEQTITPFLPVLLARAFGPLRSSKSGINLVIILKFLLFDK